MQPGYVCLPAGPARLFAVVASGVAVTIFDKRLDRGGMGHYARPYRNGRPSTAMYACPAIVSLVKMFQDTGSVAEDLDAYLYGGAVNHRAAGYVEGVSEDNVRVGLELLQKLNVSIAGLDVGGTYGRKIIFHAGTGEALVAKVEKLRTTDWYV